MFFLKIENLFMEYTLSFFQIVTIKWVKHSDVARIFLLGDGFWSVSDGWKCQ